jgi:hypothetical protein
VISPLVFGFYDGVKAADINWGIEGSRSEFFLFSCGNDPSYPRVFPEFSAHLPGGRHRIKRTLDVIRKGPRQIGHSGCFLL